MWVASVKAEAEKGVNQLSAAYCARILDADWLGAPAEVGDRDGLRKVAKMRRRIAGLAGDDPEEDPTKHYGEAESIIVAQEVGGTVLTDDWPTYEFIRNQLTGVRVIDSFHVLREAVAAGELTKTDAADFVKAVLDHPARRSFLRGTPVNPAPGDFD